mgnify:CR=1 FL=1
MPLRSCCSGTVKKTEPIFLEQHSRSRQNNFPACDRSHHSPTQKNPLDVQMDELKTVRDQNSQLVTYPRKKIISCVKYTIFCSILQEKLCALLLHTSIRGIVEPIHIYALPILRHRYRTNTNYKNRRTCRSDFKQPTSGGWTFVGDSQTTCRKNF